GTRGPTGTTITEIRGRGSCGPARVILSGAGRVTTPGASVTPSDTSESAGTHRVVAPPHPAPREQLRRAGLPSPVRRPPRAVRRRPHAPAAWLDFRAAQLAPQLSGCDRRQPRARRRRASPALRELGVEDAAPLSFRPRSIARISMLHRSNAT